MLMGPQHRAETLMSGILLVPLGEFGTFHWGSYSRRHSMMLVIMAVLTMQLMGSQWISNGVVVL